MNNSYKKNFMRLASSLDATVEADGEITRLATEIVEHKSDEAVIEIYKKIINVLDGDYPEKIKQISKGLREALISYIGYARLKDICTVEKQRIEELEQEKSLTELLEDLNKLVGLQTVKREVNDLIAYQKVQKLRKELGLATAKNTMHMAFTGNPGTGKTTVARIVGHVYKQLGLLSKGHFLEVSRTDLIAGYQGQTALKVKEVIESIKGGVLFIDEAYSITENDHSDSYGRECLTELTKALEDYREDLVVIVAGYTEPMNKFFESNPGLKSRFNKFIEFNDYDEHELFEILNKMCSENDYMLEGAAKNKIVSILESSVTEKEEQFANGRFVRNLYEDLVLNQARRVAELQNPEKSILIEIREVDVPDSLRTK